MPFKESTTQVGAGVLGLLFGVLYLIRGSVVAPILGTRTVRHAHARHLLVPDEGLTCISQCQSAVLPPFENEILPISTMNISVYGGFCMISWPPNYQSGCAGDQGFDPRASSPRAICAAFCSASFLARPLA